MTNGNGPVFGLATALTRSTIQPAALGQWAEANGFESVWFGEHSHIPVELKSERRNYKEVPAAFRELYDPLLALTAIAAATTTLKLGTSVLIIPEHHPIRLAKMLTTLDHLSGGRVIIGAGGGWSAEEMADYGIAFKDRWKWVRECVLAMREIWTKEISEFSGDMIRFPPMWCGPAPVQKAGPLILIGASGKFAFPRIAEYGDGWVPVDQGDAMPSIMAELRDYMAEAGRSFDDLEHSVVTHPLTQFGGDTDALRRRVEELHAMGFRRMLLTLPQAEPNAQWQTLEALRGVVRSFA